MGEQGEQDQGPGVPGVSRRRFLQGAAVGVGMAAADVSFLARAASAAPNPVSVENALPGNPPSEWDMFPNTSIEGFATSYSVNAGDTIDFKIQTDSTAYHIDIFRLGWYGGNGARKIATVLPSVALPQTQPAPVTDTFTGLVDCGNWAVSASWAVPASAVSGVYVANLVRDDVPESNRIVFVVRNDGRTSDVLVQTSDTTHQAYNRWGGNSLYFGSSNYGRAVKVSYNRPLQDAELENEFFYAELPLVRWLERNGYDVSYLSGLDTHSRPAELLLHKAFVSSGHDEYWSGGQRTNVEAARDAGVHLIFLSGNEVFWKVRFEDSASGPSGNQRTLVCYKETLEGVKLDPSPEWTGTWRDPRFSPPSDGGRPENALTGTLFKAINPVTATDFAIQVPYAYSRLRLWRNTTVAALTPGQTATLGAETLGYEWDADVDNGFRPAGLIRLSETTASTGEILRDFGGTYTPGSLTHHLTLYRAASGALVFGAGTVQWAFGLDDYHLTRPEATIATNPAMQQATVNLLADMGVQPATLQAGLVAATQSTDTVPPTVTITAPTAGSTVALGSQVIVTGTATDVGGGEVAGVEVSTDGSTWHPATGTTSWTYSFSALTLGALTIRVRAADDSCNLSSPTSVALTVGPRSIPCSIWPATFTPATIEFNDATPIELGVRFRVAQEGFIRAVRFYKGPGNTGTHTGSIWSNQGALLGTTTFTNETASGWQQQALAAPVRVVPGVTYVASYFAPNGRYSGDSAYFATAFDLPPLRALATGEDGPNGVFRAGSAGFPTSTFNAANYWVDVVFDTNNGLAPTVSGRFPAAGLDAVDPGTVIKAGFSERVVAGSIALSVTGPGGALAGSLAYDSNTAVATFTPSAPLAADTQYTVTVSSATDLDGAAMTSPVSWSFRTAGAPSSFPLTLWTTAAVPAVEVSNDPNAVELGVKFNADADILVTALRYYRPGGAVGTRTGRLWTDTGTLLATVTFPDEPLGGWQQAALPQGVVIVAGSTYIASVLHPNGGYPASGNYFATSTDRGVLHAPASNSVPGGNGVFVYGASGGFPTNSFGATNYWVDVVASSSTDVTPPQLVDQSPAPGLRATSPATTVTARFNEPIAPASLSFTLTGPGGAVAATVVYDGPSRTATLTPSTALANATTYTARVAASDPIGNAMVPVTWTFGTEGLNGASPTSIWPSTTVPGLPAANDPTPIEVGVKFTSDRDGVISAVRFYKGPGNLGTHVARLWSSTGTLLATASPSVESGTGWQQATFSQPVPITAGTTYVASYYAPLGRYAFNGGGLTSSVDRPPLHALASGVSGGNGVFNQAPGGGFPTQTFGDANYWVDVVLEDVPGPSVTSTVPATGATNVNRTAPVQATFDRDIVPGTVVFSLRDTTNASIPVTASYNSTTRTMSWTPNSALAPLATFTATITAAQDSLGRPLSAPVTWSFTTADLPGPVVTTVSPAAAATNVVRTTTVTATFDKDVVASSIVLTVRNAAGTAVAGAVTYNSASRLATFTPTLPLAGSTTFTAAVTAATDTAGRPLVAPRTWTFTTRAAPAPVSLFPTATPSGQTSSTSPIEVGVRFRSSAAGLVTAIRFFKQTGNTGTHIGRLWTTNGQLLASVTFTGETASGWQRANLTTPVRLTPNTLYIASYYAPNGRYSTNSNTFLFSGVTNGVLTAPATSFFTASSGNGMYRQALGGGFPNVSGVGRNYWVDVVFEPD